MKIRVTKDDGVEISLFTVEQIANMGYDVSGCDPTPDDIHLHLGPAMQIIWVNRQEGGVIDFDAHKGLINE